MTVRQSDIKRAIAAVRQQGLEVYSTTIKPDGTIVIMSVPPIASEQISVDSKPDPYTNFEA